MNCENPRPATRFSAEIAVNVLPKYFAHIKQYEYLNILKINEVEPIINYIRSFSTMDKKDNAFYQNCRKILADYINEHGFLTLQAPRHLFICN